MRKTFPLLLVINIFLVACGGLSAPPLAATTTPIPTLIPTLTPPTLIREIKLETQTGTAYTLAWSPDGETLAVASGSEITLLSADLKETLVVLEPKGGALGVTWSPDKTQFATVNGYRNPSITLWNLDIAKNQIIHSQQIPADVDQYGASWSPNRKFLATLAGDSKSVIHLWDTEKWEVLRTFDLPYAKPRRALNWNRNSSTLYASGESEGQVVIFAVNMTNGEIQELRKFSVSEAEVFAVSPDASQIAIADPRGIVSILDLVSGEALTGIKSVDQPVDLAWNPDGNTLAILGYKTTLQLWEILH